MNASMDVAIILERRQSLENNIAFALPFRMKHDDASDCFGF